MNGNAVKRLRSKLGWTQSQLAKFLCVSGAKRVYEMERPYYVATGPTLKLLRWLASADKDAVMVDAATMQKTPTQYHPDMIRTMRKHLNLSQAEFGKLLGVHWQYVCLLETGKRPISNRLNRLLAQIDAVLNIASAHATKSPKYQRAEDALKRWTKKLKRADTEVRKAMKKVKYYRSKEGV